jgi:transposase-like protein
MLNKYKSEYKEQAVKLCKLGALDKDLADFFNITERTLYHWMNGYPDFKQAIIYAKSSIKGKKNEKLD